MREVEDGILSDSGHSFIPVAGASVGCEQRAIAESFLSDEDREMVEHPGGVLRRRWNALVEGQNKLAAEVALLRNTINAMERPGDLPSYWLALGRYIGALHAALTKIRDKLQCKEHRQCSHPDDCPAWADDQGLMDIIDEVLGVEL